MAPCNAHTYTLSENATYIRRFAKCIVLGAGAADADFCFVLPPLSSAIVFAHAGPTNTHRWCLTAEAEGLTTA